MIKDLIDPRRCSTLFGHVIDKSRSLGATLQYYKFQRVQRERNRLAHALTRRAILFADTDVWIKTLPSDLVQ